MSKALVTGASGYLAHRLLPIAAKYASITAVCRQPPHELHQDGIDYAAVDLTNIAATHQTIRKLQPQVIIHAAAANPGCNESDMWAVNFEATQSIASIAKELNCRLVFVSTDIVHNGLNAPYADNATPDPVNAYGRSKAAGEKAVLAICPNAIVARTSLIYGVDQPDRGTAGFLNTLKSGAALKLFTDVLRQPVWIDSLCESLCSLAFRHNKEIGTINLAGKQVISRADFALMMLNYWGHTDTSNITLTTASTIAGLPLNCSLQLQRADTLGFELPGVNEVLATKPRQNLT